MNHQSRLLPPPSSTRALAPHPWSDNTASLPYWDRSCLPPSSPHPGGPCVTRSETPGQCASGAYLSSGSLQKRHFPARCSTLSSLHPSESSPWEVADQ